MSQVDAVLVDISGAEAWFSPEILALDPQELEVFYDVCPDQETFPCMIDLTVGSGEHMLAPTEAALVAAAGDHAGQAQRGMEDGRGA